jgi:hypothetical protein
MMPPNKDLRGHVRANALAVSTVLKGPPTSSRCAEPPTQPEAQSRAGHG